MPNKKSKVIVPHSNEVQILVGVPGSGKSTFANTLLKSDPSYVKVSRDEYRHMLKDNWYPGEEVEDLVSAMIDDDAMKALAHGYNVILDNTHCNQKNLEATIARYAPLARVVLKFIGSELSIKEIKAQNLKRDKAVPEAVIDRMYKGFTNVVKNKSELLKLIKDKSVAPVTKVTNQDPNLPKCIIVDIDGTVAHMEDKRGPFEWNKVDQDAPDSNILNIVRSLSHFYKVFFVSGRDGSCKELTESWLDVYFGEKYTLLMRKANDFRKDNIIKEEIYNTHFKDKWYVEAVFDDRDQVVEMWRTVLGLKCIQVAYGSF